MTFHDEALPGCLQYGSVFGNSMNTIYQVGTSGHENRSQGASQARGRYNLLKQLNDADEQAAMNEFFLARRGGFAAWPLKDWKDYTTAPDNVSTPDMLDQPLGSGNGTQTQFQLQKRYASTSVNPYDRPLRLPVLATVVIASNGALVPSTDYAVDRATGVVTFTTAPALGTALTQGCEFDVPVRFDKTVEEFQQNVARGFGVWDPGLFECTEDLDSTEWPDIGWPGGNYHTELQEDPVAINFHTVMWAFDDIGPDAVAILPNPTDAPGGIFHFSFFVDAGSTRDLDLRNDAGGFVLTILRGTVVSLGLIKTATGNQWVQVA